MSKQVRFLSVSVLIVLAVIAVMYVMQDDTSSTQKAYLVAQSGAASSCGDYTGPGALENGIAPDGTACFESFCVEQGICTDGYCHCNAGSGTESVQADDGWCWTPEVADCDSCSRTSGDSCSPSNGHWNTQSACESQACDSAYCDDVGCEKYILSEYECAGGQQSVNGSCPCNDGVQDIYAPTAQCPGDGNYCATDICMMSPEMTCIGSDESNNGWLYCDGKGSSSENIPCCGGLTCDAYGKCEAPSSTASSELSSSSEPSEECGNGDLEGNEECDDGNTDNTDTCTTSCKRPFCGDGYVQPTNFGFLTPTGEECDLGAANFDPNSFCHEDCTDVVCALLEEGEEIYPFDLAAAPSNSLFASTLVAAIDITPAKCAAMGGVAKDPKKATCPCICKSPNKWQKDASGNVSCKPVSNYECLMEDPDLTSTHYTLDCRDQCSDAAKGKKFDGVAKQEDFIESCVAECTCECDVRRDNGGGSGDQAYECYAACLDNDSECGVFNDKGEFSADKPDCCRAQCIKNICPVSEGECAPFCGGLPNPPPECFPIPNCGIGGVDGCDGVLKFVNNQCQCEEVTFDVCGPGGNGGNGVDDDETPLKPAPNSSAKSSTTSISVSKSSSSSSVVDESSSSIVVSSASSLVFSSVEISSVSSLAFSSVVISETSSEAFSSSGFFSSIPPSLCGNGVVDSGEDCDNGSVCNQDEYRSCDSNSECNICAFVATTDEARCGGVESGELCSGQSDCAGAGFICEYDTVINPECSDQCTLPQASSEFISSTFIVSSSSSSEESESSVISEEVVRSVTSSEPASSTQSKATSAKSSVKTIIALRSSESSVSTDEDDDGGILGGSNSCGNGSIERRESCDDGNRISGDGCSDRCIKEDNDGDEIFGPAGGCGNGRRERTEQCDDGNRKNGDGCNTSCEIETIVLADVPTLITPPPTLVAAASICGNGILEDNEECDDSNRRDEDGCSSTCLLEIGICGDGIVQTLLGEQCEGSTHDSSLPYNCSNCRFLSMSCGDRTVDAGEECDDGPLNSSSPDALCRPDCSLSRCGDRVLDSAELCDDGNHQNGDGCDRFCRIEVEEPDTLVAAAETTVEFPDAPPQAPATQVQGQTYQQQQFGFPQFPNYQQLPYQLPLASLQPLIQAQGPIGDTGPAAVAVGVSGIAAGWSFMRRKKKK
jgi:cysteine-rich repeat protein